MPSPSEPAPEPATPVAVTGATVPGRSGTTIAWLALLVIVAVAGAGLVTSLDHAQTEAGRPELTAHGHALLASRLSALEPSLSALAAAVEGTGGAGRDVLTNLRRLDPTATSKAVDAGYADLALLAPSLATVTAGRATLLDGTTMDALPASDVARVVAIDAAVAAATALPADWALVAASVDAPLTLLSLLDKHDQQVLAATDSGRAQAYADALLRLGAAGATLDRARAIATDAQKRGLDATTVDGWIGQLAGYDAALSTLYTALEASPGVMTAEAQTDLAAVEAAQAVLPTDRTGLILIVTDLGGVPITDALLKIEAARGAVDAATGTID